MKLFERFPSRYDTGIKLITLGSLDKAYDRLIKYVDKDSRVLDIGCGTGALAIRAAIKGAHVKGIDINPCMMDIAKKRAKEANASGTIELCEMGIAELDTEADTVYDVVMSGLCFSELSENERVFTLKQIKRILKPGGILLLADEVNPESVPARFFFSLFRFFLVIITWLITRTTTHPVDRLREKVEKMNLSIIEENRTAWGSFLTLTAKKETGK